MVYANIGLIRLTRVSPIDSRVGVRDMVACRFEVDEELGDLEENMERLTIGISHVTTDDLPKRY